MFPFRKRFRDQVVVVTGAGSGIGRATAHAFAKQGARLHLLDIHRARVEETAAELRLVGAGVRAHEGDVRDPEVLERLAERVYAEDKRCDVLVNNAGVGHSALVQETSLDDWTWVLETNLWGVIHGIHAFVPRMIDQGGKSSIINTASIAGLMGIPSMAPYCTSKFAVVGLSESLGAELRPYGIHVAAVCPGIIDTDIVRSARIEGSLGIHKRRMMDIYAKRGIPAERVARDIVKTVRSHAPLATTTGRFPLLLLRRVSPRAYRSVAGLALGRLLGGPQ